MKENLIQIQISDRSYSLKINPEDEQILRDAAQLIEKKLLERKERGINDKQDLLAMIAFDVAVQNIRLKQSGDAVGKNIDELTEKIQKSLQST
ncbi:cell division protein ZapA [Flammeovirgaceae bacterium SG7u.111]|nr:cell division protein ZapA [Flammeovirgaceae bacterium SG7u.132]WPO35071.1 cell division protein ZapA [Flammeovirgaceae bacterium SG7u.111]